MVERTCRTCGATIEDIVGLVQHDCDEILAAPDLTRGEQSTLLYVEARLVDHGGDLAHEQMNHEDRQNLKPLQAAGLLRVEDFRVEEFTDRAWDLVRDCRQMRAARSVERDINLGTVPGEETPQQTAIRVEAGDRSEVFTYETTGIPEAMDMAEDEFRECYGTETTIDTVEVEDA